VTLIVLLSLIGLILTLIIFYIPIYDVIVRFMFL